MADALIRASCCALKGFQGPRLRSSKTPPSFAWQPLLPPLSHKSHSYTPMRASVWSNFVEEVDSVDEACRTVLGVGMDMCAPTPCPRRDAPKADAAARPTAPGVWALSDESVPHPQRSESQQAVLAHSADPRIANGWMLSSWGWGPRPLQTSPPMISGASRRQVRAGAARPGIPRPQAAKAARGRGAGHGDRPPGGRRLLPHAAHGRGQVPGRGHQPGAHAPVPPDGARCASGRGRQQGVVWGRPRPAAQASVARTVAAHPRRPRAACLRMTADASAGGDGEARGVINVCLEAASETRGGRARASCRAQDAALHQGARRPHPSRWRTRSLPPRVESMCIYAGGILATLSVIGGAARTSWAQAAQHQR